MLCEKMYVDVNIDVRKDGSILPRFIVWPDGEIFEIDRLKHVCKAASTKTGGYGIRYTIVVRGHETFLFSENNRWFVDAKRG